VIDIDHQVAHWRDGAREEWEVAADLIEKGRVRHALFFTHLAVEKALKAHLCRHTGDLAPRLRRSARMTHLCSRKVDHPGRCGCGGTDGESVALSPQRGVAWSPQSGLLLSLPSGGRGYADLGHHWGNSIGARQCSRSLD